MSALRAAGRQTTRRPGLRVVRNLRPGTVKIALVALSGLVAIQLLHVLMGGFTAQFTYEISDLKSEKRSLNTQSEILTSEVTSLASNQNLVNVAHSLGMVTNVNPVFLRLSDATVIGKPRKAQANARTVSQNLVPNAAMTINTDTADLSQDSSSTVLDSPKSALASGADSTIQASPTN